MGGSPPVPRVLVVEDSPPVRAVVARVLEQAGYDVVEAGDGPSALEAVGREPLDLIVLDVVIPGIDGLGVLTRVRRQSDLPVILLTSRGGETDRIVGLELGADDYVVKPFSPGELVARVKAVLRRAGRAAPGATADPAPPPGRSGGLMVFGSLSIDASTRRVCVEDRPVDLTHREFDLLSFLAHAPGQVFDRAQLLDHVWSSSTEWQDPATVTEHVRRLRQKLSSAGDAPERIRTVRGVGYSLEASPE